MAERSRHAEEQARYVARHPEAVRETVRRSMAKRRSDPEWYVRERERKRKWRNANQEALRAQQRAWKARNREKIRANKAVYKAVMRGELVNPGRCSQCGGGGLIDAHHEDYTRVLDVIWLCRMCHAAKDIERRVNEIRADA